jgi:hypothetical protein
MVQGRPADIPVDEDASALIPYRGKRQLPYISLAMSCRTASRRALQGKMRSSAPPRRACSTCARRRSTACIPGWRSTPT